MIFEGLFNLSIPGYIGIALLLTHITIASVTIFLHRHQSHRSLELHPLVSHFFRFWLWLTTGMVTREWVAVHRKHHARCETEDDPHSPRFKGIHTVLWKGAFLYRKEANNHETLSRYGHNTPDDWVERNVYGRHPVMGVTLMGLIDLLLFGPAGLVIFIVQMIWIPFWAAGVINGIGHWIGYRNFETRDASTNIVPLGILIGGEELHNNHHAYAASARLSNKWWEFDLGWMYIRLLEMLRLARVRRISPTIKHIIDKRTIDIDTLRAVMSNRFHIMKLYGNRVIKPAFQEANTRADAMGRDLLQRARRLMIREDVTLSAQAQETLQRVQEQFRNLATVYRFKQQLKKIWARTSSNQASRMQRLQAWCTEAEQTGIQALEEFARYLRGYAVERA